MALVTPAEIALNVPGHELPEDETVNYWISVAELKIRNKLGDLDELNQDNLRYVIVQAVSAHVRNPDGLTRVDVAVNGASESRTIARSTGEITIKDEWWEMLSPTTKKSRQAFTIEPAFPLPQAGTLDFSLRPDLQFQWGWPGDEGYRE